MLIVYICYSYTRLCMILYYCLLISVKKNNFIEIIAGLLLAVIEFSTNLQTA